MAPLEYFNEPLAKVLHVTHAPDAPGGAVSDTVLLERARSDAGSLCMQDRRAAAALQDSTDALHGCPPATRVTHSQRLHSSAARIFLPVHARLSRASRAPPHTQCPGRRRAAGRETGPSGSSGSATRAGGRDGADRCRQTTQGLCAADK